MERLIGTMSMGVRAPIIREGDDLCNIVVTSVLEAAKSDNFELRDRDVVRITESIVATAKISIPNLVSIKINGDAGGYNSHPSVASHKKIAETLTKFIKDTLGLE